MRYKLILISSLFFLFKCVKKEKVLKDNELKVVITKEFIKRLEERNVFNKEIVSRIRNEEIDSIAIYYSNKKKIDTIDLYYDNKLEQRVFYNNGQIKRKGFVYNKIYPLNEWSYYDSIGHKVMVKDFFLINKLPHINQEWHFDMKGDVIYEGSFFELKFDDSTININETFKAIVNLPVPFYKEEKSKIIVCLAKDTSADFSDDFSNQESVEKVCFKDFETTKVNRKWIEGVSYNHTSLIGRKYETKGIKFIKGIITEYLEGSKDSLNLIRKKYFKIPITVK